jgi:2,4-dienoyl-CoA reductase-like NADH-dependent reductase (Old Yellow Enzyme family)
MAEIFEPTSIGTLSLKNRLWRSATFEKKADEQGHLTPELVAVYENLAKGGVGTIITGYAGICEEEKANPKMMGIYDDSFIPEYKIFTDKIHSLSANIIMQIAYGGSQSNYKTENRLILGPSAVEHTRFKVTPIAMNKEQISYIIKSFADSARRVKESGFDGVQLHAAHGYLLSQFLTPYYNRREDEYGGSIENRARIICETLDAVRAEVGPDYPVFIKMHCTDEMGEQGLNKEDSLVVAKMLEEKGISGIEFSGGFFSENDATLPDKKGIIKKEKQSYFREPVSWIASELNVPVILVGGNREMEVMEEILNTTDIKYFSLSRTLFSEPDLPEKWQSGYRGKPRCIACGKCRGKDTNECILNKK